MLLKAAINGRRTREEHPGIPIAPEEQAREAAAAVAAGAGGIHVHVRGSDGRESLRADDIARAVQRIRAACPGTPLGVSTGAWIVPDASLRIAEVRSWKVLPDFASVNVHEDGAIELMRLLLDLGVGVEAGVWNPPAAQRLRGSGLMHDCLRVLIEPAENADPISTLREIEAALGQAAPSPLLHGFDATAWQFVGMAAERGYDTRIGLEDTLTLPDGSVAENNAALVAAALEIIARTPK
jgi:uncharacterized protein (DUF849 family)